jgi:4-cresol dehydrogenase (hydroxylating)
MANRTQAMLPPGVSAQDFQTALKEWEKIVGSEYVFAQPENLASYSKIMIPDDEALHRPSGAVAPANVEEIQAILKVANRYRLPLWMISTGKNLGYGSAAPATAGQVVLDLKRMNRILEVDEEMGTALIEPGVTYLQLKQYLDERKIPLWLSFPSSGPIAGPVGNTLDRGVGYNRYGEHFANFCGLEVVLADGLVVRTATGGVKGSNTWQSYRWGYGPWVDGLFSQSNFGIVTKMGLWLMHKPAASKGFLVGWNDDEDMAKGVDVTRRLHLDNVIENGVIGHSLYHIAQIKKRSDLWGKPGAIPQAEVKRICNEAGLGIWGFICTLYGTEEQIAVNLKIAQEAFKPTGGQMLIEGMPEIANTPFVHWNKNMTNQPTLTEFGVYNYRGGGGSAWFAPLVQCKGSEVLKQLGLVRPVLEEYGFDHLAGFLTHGRYMEHIVDILFDRNDPDEMKRAHDCFAKLISVFTAAGYGLYRTNTAYMDKAAEAYGPAQRDLNCRLKRALDPNGIIAPGKSGITI